jgi:hypothetical protein
MGQTIAGASKTGNQRLLPEIDSFQTSAEVPSQTADAQGGARKPLQMINPVSHASSTSHADQVSRPAVRQPQPEPPQKQSTVVHDKVTLSKTKNVDHGGESK